MPTSLQALIDSLFDPAAPAGPWLTESGEANHRALAWPPDAFAVAATVLRDSGAYLQVARPHHYPADCRFHTSRWSEFVKGIAAAWRSRDSTKDDPPAEVCALIEQIAVISQRYPLSELSRPDPDNLTWLPFVMLMCIADQTCRGAGVLFPMQAPGEPEAGQEPGDDYPWDSIVCRQCAMMFREKIKTMEEGSATDSFRPLTLCRSVLAERAIVLPKMRTSQRGVTIRSLSLHLALLNGSDVEPVWSPSVYALLDNTKRRGLPHGGEACSPDDIRDGAGPYNLIVYPWPKQVLPHQFHPLDVPLESLGGRPRGRDAFFWFKHEEHNRTEFLTGLKHIIAEAEKHVGKVHGVVLPEMSVCRETFNQCFGKDPLPNVHFLVAGVYEPPHGSALGKNYALVQRWIREGEVELRVQEKHHRWALDGGQIGMYALGSSLRGDKTWWEGIDLPRRRLCFFGIDSFNTFTVLICEDLARPDPVGDAVRAVGPNLVICLLMDGPQLATRWSARYSTVLADDPGSSVLTVSSIGMVNLSRLRERLHERSRVVCLWREPGQPPVELTLEDGADALLLSLASEPKTEWTIDGRDDSGMASVLRLAGVHPLSLKS